MVLPCSVCPALCPALCQLVALFANPWLRVAPVAPNCAMPSPGPHCKVLRCPRRCTPTFVAKGTKASLKCRRGMPFTHQPRPVANSNGPHARATHDGEDLRTLGGVGLWSTDAGEARAGRHRCKILAGVWQRGPRRKMQTGRGWTPSRPARTKPAAKVPQASCRFQFGRAGQSGARAMRQRGADDRSP